MRRAAKQERIWCFKHSSRYKNIFNEIHELELFLWEVYLPFIFYFFHSSFFQDNLVQVIIKCMFSYFNLMNFILFNSVIKYLNYKSFFLLLKEIIIIHVGLWTSVYRFIINLELFLCLTTSWLQYYKLNIFNLTYMWKEHKNDWYPSYNF